MELKNVEKFPYIMDTWEKLVGDAPNEKFVYDGVTINGLTRAEIDDQASRVYAYLKSIGVSKEDFVMICLPRCAEVIASILGVLKAGAAFAVVDSHYAKERLDFIYNDCGCKAKIDLELWSTMMDETPLSGHEITDPHDACFAVYTSGSTGNPKGVLHEYGKLKLIQLTAITPYCDSWNKGGCRFGLIPPLNFVAALKFIVYGIYTGFRIYIVPTETIKNPKKLKKYYLDNQITDTHFAPSVIRAAGNDFGPYLKRVITGSEPPNGISFETASLINNYTMSESAFVVAQYEIKKKEESVPIGIPNYDDIKVHLLNENGEEVEDGESGEICFENPYFRGYIHMPEETENALRGGMFHTGDLGRKTEDGNYVIAGRMNDMIKINGNRVEPAEVERHAKEILGIDWCTVKGFVEEDKAFLCLYYTADISFDIIETKEKFGAVLPYYMVPSYYIKLDEVPLLPNNKINKKALPKPDADSYRAEYVKPRNDLEVKLCQGFEKVLGIEKVGIHDDFFGLGGDSLTAMELLELLDWDQFNSMDVYNGITPERIAALYMKRISSSVTMSPEEYEMEARKHPHRLTEQQVYIFDSSLFKPKYSTWNLVNFFKMNDRNNMERLKDAVNKVIENTPIFSTMIDFDSDYELRQRYVPEKRPVVEIEHVTDEEFETIRTELAKHTNIINSYLCEIRLFETESCGYMFLNRHHMATDGLSKRILYTRIADAYLGKPLPLDTYYSYIQKWEDSVAQEDFEADKKYYSERYGDIDWSYIVDSDHDLKEKASNYRYIPAHVTQDLVGAFEKNTGVTRNHLFNLCLILTTAKFTGKKSILTSYTYQNRTNSESRNAIGCLYKQFPLSAKLDSYRNLAELYEDIKSQATGNIKHGNYNWFEVLMQDRIHEITVISYETDEIMSSAKLLEEIGMQELEIGYSDILFSPNYLSLPVIDTPEGFMMVFIYQTNMYNEETILKFAECFNDFLVRLVRIENPADVEIEALIGEIGRE